jgi:hypothetical protein
LGTICETIRCFIGMPPAPLETAGLQPTRA